MIFVFKKLSVFLVIFCILFSFSASAENKISVTVDDEFSVYDLDPSAVAKALDLSVEELEQHVNESHIIYLAVNKTNTKQIKVNCYKTDFSSSIVNLSSLSDDKINSVMADIVGDDIKGEIINDFGQKFIKRVVSVTEESKECTITQYITVANREYYLLSFYTAKGEDDSYIQNVKFESPFFINEQQHPLMFINILPIAAIIFLAVGIFVVITIIKDFKNKS